MTNKSNNYNKPFRITENIGNNVFCFDKTKNPKLYVPNLISVNIEEFKSNIDNYLKIWSETVFREEEIYQNKIHKSLDPYSSPNTAESSKSLSSHKIKKYHWLKNFIQINTNSPLSSEEKGRGWGNIYIFDNHNHALYFRYKEYFAWNIKKWSKLIHIDQHTDMNDNKHFIASKTKQSINLDIIFNFTNQNCNVWNFIKPAVEEWLIWNITQINTEYSLLNIQFPPILGDRGNLAKNEKKISDIDLDFRAPEMSIAKYQETIDITKKLIQNSRVVTIATSPYFLDQNLAIKIIKDLFQ